MKLHRKCARYTSLDVRFSHGMERKLHEFHWKCARYANLVVRFSHGMETKLYETP